MENGCGLKQNGFTLIEAMVVLVLIAILLAIIPSTSKLNLEGDLAVHNLMKFIRKGKVESFVKQKAFTYRILTDRVEKYTGDKCFGDPIENETFALNNGLEILDIPIANQFCFNPNLKYQESAFNIILGKNSLPSSSLQILTSGVVILTRL